MRISLYCPGKSCRIQMHFWSLFSLRFNIPFRDPAISFFFRILFETCFIAGVFMDICEEIYVCCYKNYCLIWRVSNYVSKFTSSFAFEDFNHDFFWSIQVNTQLWSKTIHFLMELPIYCYIFPVQKC